MDKKLIRITHVNAHTYWPFFFLSAFLLAGCGGAPIPSADPVTIPAASPTPTSTPGADTTLPVLSISAPATNATVSGVVTMSVVASDPVVSGQTTSGIAGVQFMLDGANLGVEDTVSPYSISVDTKLFAGGKHNLTAVARDNANNKTTSSAISVTISNASVVDAAAPSVPAGGSVALVSSSQIMLTWNASTDNVGVTGYRVFRNGSSLTAASGTSYQDSGLVASNTYTYTLQAYDAAGNISALSTGITATTPVAGAETSLSALAASMQPGTWAELKTSNLLQAITPTGACAIPSIFPYTDQGAWDPVSRQFFFIGGDHAYDASCREKFIAYSAATNVWRDMDISTTPFASNVGHNYNLTAMLPQGGVFYRMHFCCSPDLWKYTISTNTWTKRAALSDVYEIYGGLQPGPNSGELIAVYGGRAFLYKDSTNQWSTIASGLSMGAYQNFAVYNPVHKVVLFGGGSGSSAMYKVDVASKVTKLANAPFELNVNGTSLITVDPVSGDYLIFGGADPGEFYSYNVLTDRWTRKSSTFPIYNPDPDHGPFWKVIASPISTYGVTMFIKHSSSSDARAYLYKHASP